MSSLHVYNPFRRTSESSHHSLSVRYNVIFLNHTVQARQSGCACALAAIPYMVVDADIVAEELHTYGIVTIRMMGVISRRENFVIGFELSLDCKQY